ncbi:pyridoxamine 5'-phosphate oxidase [Phytoactinopolyspora halophila]|uniref:pyridoxamine 5'-phosphate oxidase n=1 Tax=Phytoactinopolyspora halophila TaxID=1981511 RepID=UPI001B8BF0E7|nr:pyridoxamine 5'-phosphate oxidase [Phytoactinopolyspora halophila]
MTNTLGRLRRRYASTRLLEQDLADEPFTQFRAWLHDAVTAGLSEPNAMVLATATADGTPSARHVLLKELDSEGFVFFTNHESRKVSEIHENPRVSLCFPWFPMERQVVACGTAAPVSREESRAYWVTRPRESQIGAWASAQSAVIDSRADLEASAAAVAAKYPHDLPLPDFWGGYRVVPDTVEFWQGGPGRLHDRLRYRRAGAGLPDDQTDAWTIERLAP